MGIVASRFNGDITQKLLEGAVRTLQKAKVEKIEIHWVPGAFEIPLALTKLGRSKKFDGLISLGAVVRGETPHFDYVASQAARGVMNVSLQFEIPIAFGVLTTDTIKQALDRAGGRHGNKGEEAALVVIEMIEWMKK